MIAAMGLSPPTTQTGGARAVARCRELSRPPYSETDDGLFRAYLTPAHAAACRRLGEWMREAGMATRVDPAGNVIGRYEGSADAPLLLIGSHIDSVRDAGCFDGPLGIMLGIELVAELAAEGKRLPFAIEVIAFGDEPSLISTLVRFALGAIAAESAIRVLALTDPREAGAELAASAARKRATESSA